MAFDDIFSYIGEMGTYQICLFMMLGMQSAYEGFQAMAMIFLGPDHDHWCAVEELSTIPYEQQKYVSIPYNEEDNSYERCVYFDLNYAQFSVDEFCSWDWAEYNATAPVKEQQCDTWTYDSTQYASTAVSEYNLICDRAFFVGLVYSSFILALLISVSVTGIVSDYFGRKPIYHIASVFGCIFCFSGAYAPSYAAFITLRFCTAFCICSATTCAFVLLTEFVGPNFRVVIGTIFWCFFGLGFSVLTVIAYFVTDFRLIQIILAVSMTPSLLNIIIIQESPRWLVTNNQIEKAIGVLRDISEVNRSYLPDDTEDIITQDPDDSKPELKEDVIASERWTMIFMNSTMRKTIGIAIPAWIASSLVYNGLTLNIGDFAGNIYINTFISAALEIPANILSLPLMHYLGRRRTQVLSLMLAGGFCLLCVPFTTAEGSSVVTALSMIGKVFIVISYTTIYLFTAELFPTRVRHLAHGVCNTSGNMAALLAPFMGAPLMEVWIPLPLLIFGVAGVITGPLLLLLPETKGRDLPDTIEEAEALWKRLPSNHIGDQSAATTKL